MIELPKWPYLTGETPGIRGNVKVRNEDFVVEEIPRYPCSGTGTHVFFVVEKTGLTTLELVRRLARALDRKQRDFGYAGLKDSRAVTRQQMSLEHVEPERIEAVEIPGVKILSIDRHGNKLKLGHLSGNRFRIKVRNVSEEGERIARESLEIMQARGVPNYFGVQRFGVRGDNWYLGRALIREDYQAFVDQFCGRPGDTDKDMVRRARSLYDQGQYELAAEVWPGFFRDPKRVCRMLSSSKLSPAQAVNAIDRKLKRLFVSAYQSYLFNAVLARRIDGIETILPGDLAAKTVNNAVFRVEDATVEQPRADAFEISPTGPLYGYRMELPEGEPGQIEREVLAAEDLTLDDFRSAKGHKVKGSRRALRVPIRELDVERGGDEHGSFLQLCFEMRSGSYATAVLRELMKEHLLSQDRLGDDED